MPFISVNIWKVLVEQKVYGGVYLANKALTEMVQHCLTESDKQSSILAQFLNYI